VEVNKRGIDREQSTSFALFQSSTMAPSCPKLYLDDFGQVDFPVKLQF
jgi:hypothetical protein